MKSSNNSQSDNDNLWSEWLRSSRWQSDLARKATHKALDIPDEDVEINAQRIGMSAGGVAAIAAAAGLGPIGMVGLGLMSGLFNHQPPAAVTPPPAEQSQPQDSEYDIRFFDSDGKLIEVPQHTP